MYFSNVKTTLKAMKNTKEKKKNQKIPKNRIISTVSFFVVLIILATTVYLLQGGCEKLSNSNKTIQKTINSVYKNDLKVHFIDVGQGDAIIIHLPNDEYFMIDSGPISSESKLFSYIDNVLLIDKIDYVLATHPDSDHIGAMADLFNRYEIGYVFRPYVYFDLSGKNYNFPENFNVGAAETLIDSSDVYFNFLKAIVNENCGWEFFDNSSDLTINVKLNNSQNAVCSLDFLTSLQDYKVDNINNVSPILTLSFLNKIFMFTGDIDSDFEQQFLTSFESAKLPDIDVLKVSHHGSDSSTTEEFLKAIRCEYAVISCGLDNIYKHPHLATLENILNNNTILFRTDLHGNIVMTVEGDDNLKISTDYNVLADLIYQAP